MEPKIIDSVQLLSNNTFHRNLESIWGPTRDSLVIVIPISIIYAFIFVSGIFGNVITCVVVVGNRSMRTATNYYLLSLAISDLLLLITGLPTEMYLIWRRYPYVFGETYCVIQGLLAETSANATVLTITTFTVERYIAICYPFFSHAAVKLKRCIRYIFVIWIISFLFAVPQAAQFGLIYGKTSTGQIIEELSVCGLKNTFYIHSFDISMVLFFVAPMSVITVLYILIGIKLYRPSVPSAQPQTVVIPTLPTDDPTEGTPKYRNRDLHVIHSKSTKRVVKMLIAVVIAFFVCWAPFQTQRLLATHGYTEDQTSETMVTVYQAITYLSGVLYYFSVVINPILYNIMSNKFRNAFRDTIAALFQKSPERRNSDEIYSSSARRYQYEMTIHPNTYTRSRCSPFGHTLGILADFPQRPIVFNFHKCPTTRQIHSDGSSAAMPQQQLMCSQNASAPNSVLSSKHKQKKQKGLVIHPFCQQHTHPNLSHRVFYSE